MIFFNTNKTGWVFLDGHTTPADCINLKDELSDIIILGHYDGNKVDIVKVDYRIKNELHNLNATQKYMIGNHPKVQRVLQKM